MFLQIAYRFQGYIPVEKVIYYKLLIFGRRAENILHKRWIKQRAVPQAHKFEAVGIRPILQVSDEPVFDRIGMNVSTQMTQMRFFGYFYNLIRSLEKGARMIISFVISF